MISGCSIEGALHRQNYNWCIIYLSIRYSINYNAGTFFWCNGSIVAFSNNKTRVTLIVSDNRPVNLDLFTIKQPLPAIASIIHRISGLLLFVGIAGLLFIFGESLDSRDSFVALQAVMSGGFAKFVLWVVVSALIYHFVAGIKHLLMDWGIGETLEGAQLGAKIVVGISAILIIYTGVSIIW